MTDEKNAWLTRPRVAILIAAPVALVLFVSGIVGAALFVAAAFLLTASWIVLWLRDIYRADLAERVAFDRASQSDRAVSGPSLTGPVSAPRYS